MGTRGFIGFVVDGTEKIAYKHHDSYPAGLGMDVLTWLREADRDSSAAQARILRVVDPETVPTEEDKKALAKWANVGVGRQSVDDWYCLLRGTQGNPAAMLEAGVIEDAGGFPAESLFAEWGYVVDFDQDVFEVYKGFQRAPHRRGRFADRAGQDGYQPVALAASWPLAQLPDDAAFMAATDPSDAE